MTDAPTITPGDGNDLLAAEYVLGVLSAVEWRQTQQRLAHDQAFANAVAYWEDRLSRLADEVEPMTPPARTWNRIARSLKARGSTAPRESLWQSLAFWRSFALGAAALSAASIAVLTFMVTLPPPRPPLVATLGPASGQPSFLATVNADGTSLTIVPAAAISGADQQHSVELWLIPAGDTTPRALGLIEAARPVRLDVPRELVTRLTGDAVLAVSIEPLGGSPTGLPTGSVVASGKLVNL
jgi:anti-sigma-K factor RskA